MQVRPLAPKLGQRIRVCDAFPYSLPNGLVAGQEVTVVSIDEGHGVFVKDDAGAERQIPIQCAMRERIYFVEGRWRRELDPLVVVEFRKWVEELERTRGAWQSGIERICAENLGYARGVLARSAIESLNTTDQHEQGME